MNKKDYLNMRDKIYKEAEQLINEGKLEEGEEKINDIKSLDNRFEEEAKAQANFNAINGIHRGYKQPFMEDNNYMSFSGGENMKREQTNEYNKEFFNYMQGKLSNSMSTTGSAGAVIPVQTFDKIIENVKQQAGIISKVRILNVEGKMSIPVSQVVEGASWHVEGEEISDTTKDTTSVTLSGYELAKLFSMSVATQSMSIPAFEEYLTTELTNSMKSALNTAILSGTGSGQATGIISGTTWNTTNSKEYEAGTTFTDLISGMKLLASNFRQEACWFMNSTTLYTLLSTVDTTGNPVYTPDTSQQPVMKLLGKEVVIDDYMANDVILFGDASYYFLNFSKPVTIQRSEDAGFTKASILYRAIAVADGKLVAPSFIKFTKAAA